MAYESSQYETVVNSTPNVQTLVNNQRTLLTIDEIGGMKSLFPARRWDKVTSRILGYQQDEELSVRYATTVKPNILAVSLFQPFSLHWEFDIGGSGAADDIIEDWWDYPSLLGITTLTGVIPRRQHRTQDLYVGMTFIGNGCKVYVTSCGAGCTLTSSSLLISKR